MLIAERDRLNLAIEALSRTRETPRPSARESDSRICCLARSRTKEEETHGCGKKSSGGSHEGVLGEETKSNQVVRNNRS
jgi:hypothetical protein